MEMMEKQISSEDLRNIARILKTIAHPVKLEILCILSKEESLEVAAICDRIGVAECENSMMSHHLAKMKDNGIIDSEKKGKQVFYRIVDRRILKIFEPLLESV